MVHTLAFPNFLGDFQRWNLPVYKSMWQMHSDGSWDLSADIFTTRKMSLAAIFVNDMLSVTIFTEYYATWKFDTRRKW